MFRHLQSTFTADRDLPPRAFAIQMLTRVLDGSLYENLKYSFHDEKNGAGEYIPLRDRRPSVRYGLCSIVVDDSISLLFSEGHFPTVESPDEVTRDELARFVRDIGLNQLMIHAATVGSVGSVALVMRILSNRVYVDIEPTATLTPEWLPDRPDELARVVEQYKTTGKALSELGYSIPDDQMSADFWFRREWDAVTETWFMPALVSGNSSPSVIDDARTTRHDLGFVPVIWVKNLPGGNGIDGACTFPPEAIDASIEIDYQLSQLGRGLKYSQDPTLLIKEPAMSDGTLIRSASNAITVDRDGDAKLLEINGSASSAVIEYVRFLREAVLERMHGNRTSADKISAAQSGRAMELMNQSLIWLADKLRISYGEEALLELMRMIIMASEKIKLIHRDGTPVANMVADGLSLRWPAWYSPTAADVAQMATALRGMIDGGILSEETATKAIADAFDIDDTAAERALIETERAARIAGAQKQVKIVE